MHDRCTCFAFTRLAPCTRYLFTISVRVNLRLRSRLAAPALGKVDASTIKPAVPSLLQCLLRGVLEIIRASFPPFARLEAGAGNQTSIDATRLPPQRQNKAKIRLIRPIIETSVLLCCCCCPSLLGIKSVHGTSGIVSAS